MIGVLCPKHQEPFAAELFQLFKTPWEFFLETSRYDVAIVNGDVDVVPQAKLVIHFHSGQTSFDPRVPAKIPSDKEGILIEGDDGVFPIYGSLSCFGSAFKALLKIAGGDEVVGVECIAHGQKIIRVGYDLLGEVEHLLSNGQPVGYAPLPTLDMQIQLLRQWILRAGLCVVEIPPIPDGFQFVSCLTHDVDFIRITDHGITDRSVLGFIARSFFPRHWRNTRSQLVWSRLLRNWRALVCLPAVYLGLARDTWYDIDRFRKLERDLGSTFYFIPRKGHPGNANTRTEPSWRAARYDVKEYQGLIHELSRAGVEIGVHGLDAWQDAKVGMEEGDTLRALSGKESVGIRMHWLYFSKSSPNLLEQAGFAYDSTVGYNEANGFRSGTAQVFCLPGSTNLLELSLNIMDTALFYSERMGLTEADAMKLCRSLVAATKSFGGVLTINWHTRSLSPERNWDSFYVELLDLLKAEAVWFTTAEEAVRWFKKRRQISFEKVEKTSEVVRVRLRGVNTKGMPGFRLRVHQPMEEGDSARTRQSQVCSLIDVPLTGDAEVEVPVS